MHYMSQITSIVTASFSNALILSLSALESVGVAITPTLSLYFMSAAAVIVYAALNNVKVS